MASGFESGFSLSKVGLSCAAGEVAWNPCGSCCVGDARARPQLCGTIWFVGPELLTGCKVGAPRTAHWAASHWLPSMTWCPPAAIEHGAHRRRWLHRQHEPVRPALLLVRCRCAPSLGPHVFYHRQNSQGQGQGQRPRYPLSRRAPAAGAGLTRGWRGWRRRQRALGGSAAAAHRTRRQGTRGRCHHASRCRAE